MIRAALLLLVLLLATPALAAGPEEQISMQWSGHPSAAGLGVIAEFNRNVEEAGVGQHRREVSTAGIAWRGAGWQIAATGGLFGYDFTGAGAGTARIASFAVGHEVAIAAGTLSFEVRQSALWEADQRLDTTSARLGWSLRF